MTKPNRPEYWTPVSLYYRYNDRRNRSKYNAIGVILEKRLMNASALNWNIHRFTIGARFGGIENEKISKYTKSMEDRTDRGC